MQRRLVKQKIGIVARWRGDILVADVARSFLICAVSALTAACMRSVEPLSQASSRLPSEETAFCTVAVSSCRYRRAVFRTPAFLFRPSSP